MEHSHKTYQSGQLMFKFDLGTSPFMTWVQSAEAVFSTNKDRNEGFLHGCLSLSSSTDSVSMYNLLKELFFLLTQSRIHCCGLLLKTLTVTTLTAHHLVNCKLISHHSGLLFWNVKGKDINWRTCNSIKRKKAVLHTY